MRCNKQKGRSIWNNRFQNQQLLCYFSFWIAQLPPTRTHFEVTLTALFTELLSITCCTNCTPVFVLCWVMMFILMTLHALDKSSASKISFSVAGEWDFCELMLFGRRSWKATCNIKKVRICTKLNSRISWSCAEWEVFEACFCGNVKITKGGLHSFMFGVSCRLWVWTKMQWRIIWRDYWLYLNVCLCSFAFTLLRPLILDVDMIKLRLDLHLVEFMHTKFQSNAGQKDYHAHVQNEKCLNLVWKYVEDSGIWGGLDSSCWV